MPTSISIVEDNIEFLEGIVFSLRRAPSIFVTSTYTTGSDAIGGIQKDVPDVTLIDIGLPDISGIDVIKILTRRSVQTEFLVLSVYEDDTHVFRALKAGAVGYIVKNDASIFSKTISAIEEVQNGGAPMSLGIARRVLNEFRSKQRKNDRLEKLTKREIEILEHLSKGYSTRKVAEILFISYETVRCHLKNIYKKLQVNSLLGAVAVLRGER